MPLFKKNQSIELLTPEESQQSLGNKYFIVILCIVAIVSELALFGVISLLNLSSKAKIASLTDDENSQLQTLQSLKQVTTDIAAVKNKIKNYDTLVAKYTGIDKKLQKLTAIIPTDVNLLSLDVGVGGKTLLKGVAVNINDGYEFYENLLSSTEVSNVSLDSISKSALGYTFDLSFLINAK